MSQQISSTTEYFAAAPSEQLVTSLSDFQTDWRKYTQQSGIHSKWRKSFRMYYGKHFAASSGFSDSDILRGGDRGEYAMLAVNHYRNLIKHTLVLATNQKPAFNIKATNTDPDSIEQTRLGRNIVEYYYGTKRLGQQLHDAAEMSQVFGKAFIFMLWEPTLGKPYTAQDITDDQGQPVLDANGNPKRQIIYEGDVLAEVKSPYDVYVDQMAEDYDKLQWCCVRTFRNKFDLAEQYPKISDQIRKLPTKAEGDLFNYMSFKNSQHTAEVPVYYFIHKTTKAMPNGRLVIFCDQDTILYDGPTPYEDKLPLFRIVPGKIFGTTEGYSDFFDLIGIQEAIDVLISIMFTNEQAQGIQKIWMPSSGNLTATQISKGLALLKSEPGTKPEPLQLTSTAKEIFESVPMLIKAMEDISGINAVARGDADHSLKSGVALAYVQTMAAQYTSAFQQSWADLNSDVTTFLIWCLKHFARTERMIAIAGKRNKSAMVSFTQHDISDIERCEVEIGNPITQTVAGRLEIAEDLLQAGLIKTPQDYIQVLESGNLETMLEGPEAQMDLIKKENESLMDGKPALAMPGDKHLLHMQEHLTTLSDPEIRTKAASGDPQSQKILNTILDHIQDHMQKYQSQQPIWSMVSGEPPAPPPPPPPGPPGPPSAMGPGGPPPGPPKQEPLPGGPGPGPMPPHPGLLMPPGAHGPKGHPLAKISQMNEATAGPMDHIPRLPPGLQPSGQMPPSAQ